MRRLLRLLLIGPLGGCAAIIPHTLMTPTVRQRGEVEIDASTGLHGTSFQAAYAPANRTVLLASGHRWAVGNRWSLAGEAGGGYQWVRPDGGSWGLYAGAGYGAGYSYGHFCLDLCGNVPNGGQVRYAYTFLQPTYTLLQEQRTNLGFAVRLQALRLNRWQTYRVRYTAATDSSGYDIPEYYPLNRSGRWVVLLQPGINARRQLSRHVCLTTNLGALVPLQQDAPTVLRLSAGVGVQLTLGRKPQPAPPR
ncbi:MAG: hypothetical protein H7Z21_19120 [Hymenobacter sp.]|nr:hypothetical protein [Hymenobacter sp.]